MRETRVALLFVLALAWATPGCSGEPDNDQPMPTDMASQDMTTDQDRTTGEDMPLVDMSGADMTSVEDMASGEDMAGGQDMPEQDAGMLDEEVASYASFREAKNRADCERDQRCEDGGDVEACIAESVDDLGEARDGIQASIDAGRIVYSPVEASSCLAATRGDCETAFLDLLRACNPVLEGAVAVGDPCERMADCADAAGAALGGPFCYEGCDPVTGDTQGQQGVCVLQAPDGCD